MLENVKTFTYNKLTEEEQAKRGILGRLVGVIADSKNPTRNGRKYSRELWDKVFDNPIMKEKIANRVCLGELGHPANRTETDIEKVAVCLAEVPKVGKDGALYGVFDILNTPNGRLLKSLCDYGSHIGISSRGQGDIIQGFDGEEVDPNTYDCQCWDVVLLPGVEKARLELVNESLDINKKTLKESLDALVASAEGDDKRIMKETLEQIWKDETNEALTEGKIKDAVKKVFHVIKDKVFTDHTWDEFDDAPEEIDTDKPEDLEKLYNYLDDVEEDIQAEFLEEIYGMSEDDAIELLSEYDRDRHNRKIAKDPDYFMKVANRNHRKASMKEAVEDKNINYGEEAWKMGSVIAAMNDEDAYYSGWLYIWPDGEDYDECLRDFGDKESFEELKRAFERRYKDEELHEGGLYTTKPHVVKWAHEFDKKYGLEPIKNYHSDYVDPDVEELQESAINEKFTDDSYEFNPTAWIKHWLENHSYDSAEEMIADLEDDGTIDEAEDACKCDMRAAIEDYFKESISESCGDKKEVRENLEVDNVKSKLLEELQEALTEKTSLEHMTMSLNEKLSVCYAKEAEMQDSIDTYKRAVSKLQQKVATNEAMKQKIFKLTSDNRVINEQLSSTTSKLQEDFNRAAKMNQATVTSLKESLAEKQETISQLNENLINERKQFTAKLTSLNKEKNSTIRSLNESINSLKQDKADLNEKVAELQKDLSLKKTEYSEKISKSTKLVEQYKQVATKVVDKYIESQAVRLGVSASDIKNKLPESYTFDDIDSICEDLQNYRVSMSRLPFQTSLNENMRVRVTSSQNDNIVPVNKADEVDESLMRLAGLK